MKASEIAFSILCVAAAGIIVLILWLDQGEFEARYAACMHEKNDRFICEPYAAVTRRVKP